MGKENFSQNMNTEENKEGHISLESNDGDEEREGIESAIDIVDIADGVGETSKQEISQSNARIESLNGDPKEAEKINDEYREQIASATKGFLAEFLESSPDVLRQRVNETASFLASREGATIKDLEEEFSLDPETAEVYFRLANVFSNLDKKDQITFEHEIKDKDSQDNIPFLTDEDIKEDENLTETDSGIREQSYEGNFEKKVIQAGSLVTSSKFNGQRKVVEIIKPENPDGSWYVEIEGFSKPFLLKDVQAIETSNHTDNNEVENILDDRQSPEGEPFLHKKEVLDREDIKEGDEIDEIKESEENESSEKEKLAEDEILEELTEEDIILEPEEQIKKKPREILRELNLDNRNLLQKLPEKSWKFLKDKILKIPAFILKPFVDKISHRTLLGFGKAKRGFGSVGGRLGVLYNSALVDREKTGWFFHGASAEGLQDKHDQVEEEIKEINESLNELDVQEKELEEGGSLTDGVKMKIENTRNKLKNSLIKAENKSQVLLDRIQESKDRMERYSEKRNYLAESLIKEIDERLTPLEEIQDKLELELDDLEEDIDEIASFLEEQNEKLDEVFQKMAKHKNLKSFLKTSRKKLFISIKNSEQLLDSRRKESFEAHRKLTNINERANPWREMRDKFNGILNSK